MHNKSLKLTPKAYLWFVWGPVASRSEGFAVADAAGQLSSMLGLRNCYGNRLIHAHGGCTYFMPTMLKPDEWPPLSDCEVTDSANLSRIRPLLADRQGMLTGKDPNSIESQIISIAWDDAIYCSYNEALRSAIDRSGVNHAAQSIADLVHRTFYVKQAIAVRRIMERKPRDPNRAVISLPSVVSEIRDNVSLITRESFVTYDGCPYSAPSSAADWRIEHTWADRQVRHYEHAQIGHLRVFSTHLITGC